MNLLKSIKSISKTYFAERDKTWKRSKRWWSFTFVCFFSLFLFQIYAAYTDWQSLVDIAGINDLTTPDLNDLWQTKADALYLQGIVLFGIFTRFLSGQFRGRWFVRFGELGEIIAFAAFCQHYVLTIQVNSKTVACGSSFLTGMVPFNSQWIGCFFFGWFVYKMTWIIAVIWKTVRK